jgi:hypothetical protein
MFESSALRTINKIFSVRLERNKIVTFHLEKTL